MPAVGGACPVIDAEVISIVGAVVGHVLDGDVRMRDRGDVEHRRHDAAGIRPGIDMVMVEFPVRQCPRMPRVGG